ncbi:hypothetical protein QCA50_011751 [Cerrena zonata]|uniref:Uncharacterized protein n=1 Tax=Cerrena zonata TaxID=2478898 RepID=A0AAW0G056_9APHY
MREFIKYPKDPREKVEIRGKDIIGRWWTVEGSFLKDLAIHSDFIVLFLLTLKSKVASSVRPPSHSIRAFPTT